MKKLKSIFFLLLATSMSFSLNGQEEPSWEQTLPRHDIQFGLGDPALLASGRECKAFRDDLKENGDTPCA